MVVIEDGPPGLDAEALERRIRLPHVGFGLPCGIAQVDVGDLRDVRSLYDAAKFQGQTGSTLAGNTRNKSDVGAATLYYKLNPLVSFGFEQSYYRTRTAGGLTDPLWMGKPADSWHDLRFESGPIFTF